MVTIDKLTARYDHSWVKLTLRAHGEGEQLPDHANVTVSDSGNNPVQQETVRLLLGADRTHVDQEIDIEILQGLEGQYSVTVQVGSAVKVAALQA